MSDIHQYWFRWHVVRLNYVRQYGRGHCWVLMTMDVMRDKRRVMIRSYRLGGMQWNLS